MAFDPGLTIGQILRNADIVDKFKCGNMGGMRRSKTTNTLVIVSDYTKGIYHDKWISAGEYIYCGRIELVSKPYTEIQPGEDGGNRNVWMFPIRPVPDNDVKKPPMFVFEDMDDYISRGKNVDAEYARMVAAKKKSGGKASSIIIPVVPKQEPKPAVVIPSDIVGKKIKHKAFGIGTITGINGTSIEVSFDNAGVKKMGYEFCIEKKMLEFI